MSEVSVGAPPAEVKPAEFKAPEPQPEKPAIEQTPEKPPREKTAESLGKGIVFIGEQDKEGAFGESGSEANQRAAIGMAYKGEVVNEETSGQLRGLVKSLDHVIVNGSDEAREKALEIKKGISESGRVRVGEEAEAEYYTFDEYNSLLEKAIPEERAEIEAKALYGFKFEEPQETKTPEQGLPAKEQADTVIKEKISELQSQLSRLDKNSKEAQKKQALLGVLQAAEGANGEIGVLLKFSALQQLEKYGYSGLGKMVGALGVEAEGAYKRLEGFLGEEGMSPEAIKQWTEHVKRFGLAAVLEDGELVDKLEGLDKLVFDRDLTESEAKSLFAGKMPQETIDHYIRRYGKKAGRVGLLAILLGAIGGVSLVSMATKG